MKNTLTQASFMDQDYLDAVLENFQDGVYITDREANTVYLNHGYELISGLTRAEMIGKNMKDLVADGVISASGTLSVLENGERITIEQSFKTGKRALITSSPVYENPQEKTNILMVVTIVREITEIYSIRKEMQKIINRNHEYANEIERLNREANGNVAMVAVDKKSVRLLHMAERVALVNEPLLISGEPGVGREKLARFIHEHSRRSRFPFLRLDWSTMPKQDLIKYLFGYEDNATRTYQIGVLESADGGSIYINELTEIPANVRDRFLALLKTGACIMGDGALRKLNVRFFAASIHSYSQLEENALIEPEILRCFSAFPMEIAPLRERRDDIIPLMEYFLRRHNKETGEKKKFSRLCCRSLYQYDWPGNVREVGVLVQRGAIVSEGNVIEESDLPADGASAGFSGRLSPCGRPDNAGDTGTDSSPMRSEATAPGQTAYRVTGSETGTSGQAANADAFLVHPECKDLKYESARLEAWYMDRAFKKYGNIRDAADSLGIDSSTFVRKRQRYKQLGLM